MGKGTNKNQFCLWAFLTLRKALCSYRKIADSILISLQLSPSGPKQTRSLYAKKQVVIFFFLVISRIFHTTLQSKNGMYCLSFSKQGKRRRLSSVMLGPQGRQLPPQNVSPNSLLQCHDGAF